MGLRFILSNRDVSTTIEGMRTVEHLPDAILVTDVRCCLKKITYLRQQYRGLKEVPGSD